jgi:hypothetical protein
MIGGHANREYEEVKRRRTPRTCWSKCDAEIPKVLRLTAAKSKNKGLRVLA